jgi:hypothetical protein
VRVTIRHYFDFADDRAIVGADLVRPEAWDALRIQTNGPFGLPSTRAQWERIAEGQTDIARRAEQIDSWLERHGVRTLASYGVGVAIPELWLHRLRPERRLECPRFCGQGWLGQFLFCLDLD